MGSADYESIQHIASTLAFCSLRKNTNEIDLAYKTKHVNLKLMLRNVSLHDNYEKTKIAIIQLLKVKHILCTGPDNWLPVRIVENDWSVQDVCTMASTRFVSMRCRDVLVLTNRRTRP